MTTIAISEKTNLPTVINVFTVEPEQQQRIINFLLEHKEIPMKQPGFVSASFHKSLDGTRVINYIQWRDWEALEAAAKNSDFMAMAKQAAELAPHDFHTYEVVFTMQT
ncbi:antibiotic biosynthesis monooxygenase [Pleurocapsales cyanobacterium LEGE 06147]|nr:antibiotic biosynthesis monooxygenase [Pleurocapsales cyanobacterium LEGE 06147]